MKKIFFLLIFLSSACFAQVDDQQLLDDNALTIYGTANSGNNYLIGNLFNLIIENKVNKIVATRKNAVSLQTDFYNTTSPFALGLAGAAISGGTVNVIAGQANHPGIVDLRDGTTANGGYVIQTAANAFLITGSEQVVVTFQIRNARATANGWMGFKDNTTNAQPVDGAYVYFVGNGTVVTMSARTRNNSTETIAATTWQPTLNTWYTLSITVNDAANSVGFSVVDDAGTSQWTETITTNIPTAAGRETGIGIQANESTTDAAAAIMYIDYLRFSNSKTLTR